MKKIGIVSWKIGDNSFGVTTPYLAWLEHFGQIRILDYREPFDGTLDMVVVPGGPDINPERYGQIPSRSTGKPCIHREYFDIHILPHYIANFVPIFGICRGHQAINIHFGGTLNQHMYHETSFKSRSELVHSIQYRINENGTTTIYTDKVNSLHHQTVGEIGDGLKVIARYVDNKNTFDVEGLVHRELPIASVQYHPEELMTNDLANRLVYDLLEGISLNDKYKEIY
ncbi:MAG: gamma-glutamyl-gamma-aminobutyrate hydrolase family protein [bacterium]